MKLGIHLVFTILIVVSFAGALATDQKSQRISLSHAPLQTSECDDPGTIEADRLPIRLVLGLGNGAPLANSRHSLGFLFVDQIVRQNSVRPTFHRQFQKTHQISLPDVKFFRRYDRGRVKSVPGVPATWQGNVQVEVFSLPVSHHHYRLVLAKPSSEINFSGDFFDDLAEEWKQKITSLVIVYDDLTVPSGSVMAKNLRELQSLKHGGVRSVLKHSLQGVEVRGIAIGVEPQDKENFDLEEHLLSPIDPRGFHQAFELGQKILLMHSQLKSSPLKKETPEKAKKNK